jgi:ABC-type nitrate/sulfonate/bicarbonate transport system substrate-binding protein
MTRKHRLPRRLLSAIAVAGSAALVIASGSSASSTNASTGLTTVRVGIGPFLDNQTLELAQKLGYAKQQGLDLQFKILPSNDAIFQAIESGSLDIGAGTLRGLAPLAKTAPDLRNFMFRDQFKGFFLVGRKGEPTYSGLVASGLSPAAAKAKMLKTLDQSTFDLIKIQNWPPIASALQSAGLDPDKPTVDNFNDDATAALAFEHGTGDYYTGALPQQAALLLNHPGEFVNAAGSQVLGATSATYDTWTTSTGWLKSNPDVAKKIVAITLKVNSYIRDQLGHSAPQLAALLNKAASSKFSSAEIALLVKQFSYFLKPSDMASQVFNAKNPYFWKHEAEVDKQQNKAALPSGYTIGSNNDEQQYYDEYKADHALVAWVNAG